MPKPTAQINSTPIDWGSLDVAIFDLDGTLYLGESLLPGALELVQTALSHVSCKFLSNNTSKTPQATWQKMLRLGLPVSLDQVMSPLHSLVQSIRSQAIQNCWVLANAEVLAWLQNELPGVNLKASRGKCQLVVLAYDDTLTYKDLCEVGWCLQDGCLYWITHPDYVCPNPQGPVPDVGGLVELFAVGMGRRPERIFGKPSIDVLAPVFKDHAPQRVLFVGDRLYTDWELAKRSGCQFRLSLAGETTPEQWHNLSEKPLVL